MSKFRARFLFHFCGHRRLAIHAGNWLIVLIVTGAALGTFRV